MNTQNIIKEFNPMDYFIEKSKLTLLFDKDRILIIDDFDDEIMFSFFINRQLIDANRENEDTFIQKFKKYLEVDK
jgi:hypothetical protein